MAQSIVPNVYTLYWMENGKPQALQFDSNEMIACMGEAEKLRRRKSQGENISHVNYASEHPDSVGQGGVSGAAPDYHLNHWKRRLDPNVPLGRPSGNQPAPESAPEWTHEEIERGRAM